MPAAAKGQIMFARILLVTALSLWLIPAPIASDLTTGNPGASQDANKGEAKAPGEVELALADIGTGSADEIKSRLFTHRITVFSPEFRAQAVAAFSTSIGQFRIVQGKLFRRVEKIFSQVLQLHGLSGKRELFLFQDEIPNAMLWRGCVLGLSDGLADPLSDGELAAIMAHELGHSYFEDEMASAWKSKDARAMKVVELKCDAVAILSLKLLDRDPTLYLRALQRIREIIRIKGRSRSIFQSHPDLVERAQFSQRFIRSLRAAEIGYFNNSYRKREKLLV